MGVTEPGRELDLTQKSLDTHGHRQLGAEQLEGDRAVMLDIVGQVDGGHPALAQLALDDVAIVERPVEAIDDVENHTAAHPSH